MLENVTLLTVEDRFLIQDRGVLVLPLIPEYVGPMSFPVILKKPDGNESAAEAKLDIPLLNPPPKRYAFSCCVVGVSKDDVPIGTEIWIVSQRKPS